jgi:quercetin dioxygenase-like cupin family protein
MKKRVFHNPVIGDKATLIKTSDDTNGECTLLEVVVVPGGGNAFHTHTSYSEKFEVLEGKLSVTLDNTTYQLEAGDTATIPANAVHCFNNRTSAPVKFLVEFSPAQPGFEKMIAIGYGLASDGLVNKKAIPKDIRHLAILASMSGTIPSGIFKIFMPLFKLIAGLSRRVEAELVNKYC